MPDSTDVDPATETLHLHARNMFSGGDPLVAEARANAPKLPQNLSNALDLFTQCDSARAVLGDAFVDSYTKLRRAHWEDYCAHLTVWEREQYLDS